MVGLALFEALQLGDTCTAARDWSYQDAILDVIMEFLCFCFLPPFATRGRLLLSIRCW
jgi:hypothetical protein